MIGALLYILLLPAFALIALRKPHTALVAVLCMFGLEQLGQIYIPYLRSNGLFTNLFVLLLVAVAILHTYFSGRLNLGFQYRNCKVRSLSLVLYLFAFVSLLWTPVDGWTYWRNLWPYVVVSLLMSPLLINKIGDLEDVHKLFIWVGGIIIVFMAFVPEWGVRSVVISGSREETGLPLALAQLAGYLLVTAAVYFERSKLRIGWLSLIIVAALIVALRTSARGQFIFSILSILLVMPLVWKRFTFGNAMQLSMIGGLIALVSYLAFDTTVTYSSRWEAGEMAEDLNVRIDLAKTLLSDWINSPLAILFGLGNSAAISEDLVGRYPHIVPLEILGEEGLFGFALFVAIVAYSVGQAQRFKGLTFLSNEARRAYAASFGCFLFTLLLSFKQGSLINSPMIFFFAAISEKYYYLVKIGLYNDERYLLQDRGLESENVHV